MSWISLAVGLFLGFIVGALAGAKKNGADTWKEMASEIGKHLSNGKCIYLHASYIEDDDDGDDGGDGGDGGGDNEVDFVTSDFVNWRNN